MDDIYGEPEKYGLKIVAQVEEEPNYDFNMFVVWQRLADGALFYGTDSGCSCPSPFEQHNSVEKLTQFRDIAALQGALTEWNKDYDGKPVVTADKIADVERKVREVLSAPRPA